MFFFGDDLCGMNTSTTDVLVSTEVLAFPVERVDEKTGVEESAVAVQRTASCVYVGRVLP